MHKKMPINAELTSKQQEAIQRFILFRQHILIHGLAGTGKSYQIDTIVSKMISHEVITKNQVCSLTFNKELPLVYHEKYSWSNTSNTLTVHAFCHRILKELKMLPAVFVGKDSSNEAPEAGSEEFDMLITLFLNLPETTIKETEMFNSYIKDLDIITCDEAQDFREDYIQVIGKLKGLANRPRMIVAGDLHQKIYGFSEKVTGKKLSEVLEKPEILFGNDNYNTLFLNVNHRTENTSFLLFLNEYLKRVFHTDEKFLYYIPLEDRYSKFKRKPILRYFTNRNDEYDFVKKEIGKIKNQEYSIAVLGRNNKDIKKYIDMEKDERITVFTIHL